MNYGPLGDPGSYGTARSQWEPKGFTGIEYPQAMPFSGGGGGGGMRLGGGLPPWWREDSLWAGEHNEGTAHLFGNTGMTSGPAPITSPNLNFNSAPAGVSLSGPMSSGGVSLRSPRRNYSNPTRRYGL